MKSLPTLLALAVALQGSFTVGQSVYSYNCADCNCNADHSFGSTAFGDCINLPVDAYSMGLSKAGLGGIKSVRCTVFDTYGCQGRSQNMGVRTGQNWGCTNTQISWVRSAVCNVVG
ncbi:hypothetical protein BJY04DRAFT_221793 [Aspergillus karnatakaensis]|uniref:uncharacterized protein n=1 Tax=Aspergillus karnatakaensis TaxID=1810916 RepID=UPI003CCD3B38